MDHFPNNAIESLPSNKTFLAFICACMIAGLLFVGLTPFDFHPRNVISWNPSRNGLAFGLNNGSIRDTPGMAFTSKPLALPPGSLTTSGSITIEIRLLPWVEPRGWRLYIASLVDASGRETLFVSQWRTHLLVWVLEKGPSGREHYREIGIDGALIKGQTSFVTIASDEQGTAFYLDGRLVDRFPDVPLIAKDATVSGRLYVGNSTDARSGFRGEILGLAIHDNALTAAQVRSDYEWWTRGAGGTMPAAQDLVALYPFDERRGNEAQSKARAPNPLSIPETLKFEKQLLEPPSIEDIEGISGAADVAVNIAGFIPLGFLLCLWLGAYPWPRRRVFLVALAIGFSVSLTIETLQVFLPARCSSQTDLICNTLGTMAGLALFSLRTHRRPSVL
jgi:VanZ family protein